jgi:flagellar basal body-associated protein FliL
MNMDQYQRRQFFWIIFAVITILLVGGAIAIVLFVNSATQTNDIDGAYAPVNEITLVATASATHEGYTLSLV